MGNDRDRTGSNRIVIGILALLLLGGLGVTLFLLFPQEEASPPAQKPAPKKALAKAVSTQPQPEAVAKPQRPAPKGRITKFADKEARAETLAKILAAMERRKAQKPVELSPVNPSSSDKEVLDYVREPFKEIRPLLRQCYQRHVNDVEEIGGVVTMVFTIVSDGELGGLIESSQIVGDGPVTAAESLTECLRESMYAMRLPGFSGVKRIRMEMPIILTTMGTYEQVKKVPRPEPKIQVIAYEEER